MVGQGYKIVMIESLQQQGNIETEYAREKMTQAIDMKIDIIIVFLLKRKSSYSNLD